jgi:digeranylgeranylglycerophospholipid reductase
MERFDVIIVGAGPAGGQCSRSLAKRGYRVLLTEQHESFTHNNYSSAGSPLETLTQFELPESVVGAFWRNLEIISSNVHRRWESTSALGVVFDFAKLRSFLAEEVIRHQGQVWLGHRYLSHQSGAAGLKVKFKSKQQGIVEVSTRLLVDATGYARAVMYPQRRDRPNFARGQGIEYLIRVKPEIYQKYADAMVFFLGYRWSPKGYSWIFPMDNFQLKVGSAFYDAPHRYLQSVKPLRDYTKAILENYMGLDSQEYELIEIHGSILDCSEDLQDRYYGDRTVAIGDAVSTVNFLGGEGIRHGMQGAEIGVKHIADYLEGKITDFSSYEAECKQFFGKKWRRCAQIANKVYLQYSDDRIDRGVYFLKYLSTQDLVDILFYYRFQKMAGGMQRYLIYKLSTFWQRMMGVFQLR